MKEIKNCKTCKKLVIKPTKMSYKEWGRRKFCSKKCQWLDPMWKAKRPKTSATMKGKIPKNLSLMNANKKGAGNPMWQGGITSLKDAIRNSAEYKQWRTAVFIRDNRTCLWCGANQDINADHIKPYSTIRKEYHIRTIEEALRCQELWDIKNGRTLCISCHKKTPSYLNAHYKYERSNSSRL